MGILQTTHHEHIVFEPGKAEHRAAYWKLRSTGRQDERLRFILEEGFSSVITMMQTKLADHYSRPEVVAPVRYIYGAK